MLSENMRRNLDGMMDWLSEKTEDELREMLAGIRIPRDMDFCRTIGGTRYIVTSRFNRHAKDDHVRKLTRLLESEVTQ